VKYDEGSSVDAYPFWLPLNEINIFVGRVFLEVGWVGKLPVLEIMWYQETNALEWLWSHWEWTEKNQVVFDIRDFTAAPF
jgi:hypothetical protein